MSASSTDEKAVDIKVASGEIYDPDLINRIETTASLLGIELNIDEVNFVASRINVRPWQEAVQLLKEAYEYHEEDINIDYDALMRIKRLSEGPEGSPDVPQEEFEFEALFEAVIVSDWSPYAEVRAATSFINDDHMPAETIRMYIVGLCYANVGAIVGTFFGNRYPAISLGFLSLQLIIYPTGKFLEYILPDWGFKWGGKRYSLNPGPWSFKEQMLATQMMSAVDGPPFSFTVITLQRATQFFNESWASNYGYMFLLSVSASFTGYGIAGLLRGLLVYPVRCMWYGVLPLLSMNRSLATQEVAKENVHGWTLSRYRFLLIFVLVSFCYYWFPEFVFQALSYFNWTTWISPNNVTLAAVTGVFSGLGFNPISTFDWSVITGAGMVNPFYTTYTAYIGQLLGFICIVAIYFSKSFYTQYLPINDPGVFDNTGAPYNISRILTPQGTFDAEGYTNYSPAFLSAGNLITFGANFAIFTASIVYAILHYRKPIQASMKSMWISFRSSNKARKLYNDPFTRNLQVHPEVPEWWFILTLCVSLAMFIIMVKVFPDTDTPVWTVFFGIAVNLVFIIPFGLLYATTNVFLEVGVLVQVFLGYMIPHNANAMMIGQCVANNFWEQAQNYITNQKQTHYARIPSRALFRVQYTGTLVTIFTTLAILSWEFTGIKDYCDPLQPQKFSCATARSSFASNVLWGTLGPRIYLNGIYTALKWSFLIGCFLPVPFYFLQRKWPDTWRRWNVLVLLSGFATWAPSNLYYTTGNFYIGALFNWYIRKYYLGWWRKYNYILYAALNTGVAWAQIIVFFATSYNHIVGINWWGNWVFTGGVNATGADYNSIPLEAPPAVGYFGPAPGHFPSA
ncbi:Opt2p [Sugiyamaella lignohabitans]|uniref:Opt2p n=1 Tax=Sugiyamaella lignohabitans TaxID=796027 RepID=A0A167CJ47_9ASCO|nr:Opt2p [Sugiyamaella lignohabitans]ANB11766.1 Opt2p [Sugiyamaella lignohabitans]